MVRPTSNRKRPLDQVAREEGWRSGLEERIGAELASKGVNFDFEKLKIEYEKPARKAKYTPDFTFKNKDGKRIGFIVESKGRFVTADRQKHLLVKAQHPEYDIRFVFSNPNARISKTSSTTYAMWCEKHGFKYAKGSIPQTWIDELK